MNTRLLSLSSLAVILAMAAPSVAAEVAPVSDSATNQVNSEFIESNYEAFNASTSAESLGTFEAKKEINLTFSEDSTKTEVAQYGGSSDDSDSKGLYLGGNVGVYFPTYTDGKTGFGGGGTLGYQFNKNLGAEVDLTYVGGNLDNYGYSSYDLNYSSFSIIGSARYTAPLGGEASKWNYFGALGAGVSIVSVDGTIDGKDYKDLADAVGVDTSDSYFTLQTKAGIGYKFSKNFSGYGQVKYQAIFSGSTDYYGSVETGGFVSPELGIQYNF